jgi:Circadian oscillating protein COP23
MKIKLLIKIIAGIAISTATLNIYSTVEASSDKYFCQEVNGVYGIYSRTERGNMNLLNFTRDVSQDWSIETRCQEVARRFQGFYDNGLLKFIGADFVNNEPVLCAVVNKGELCNPKNILVTLPPQSDPIESARQLIDTRALANGRVIEVNGKEGKLESYIDGHTYYDLEVLEKLILESENSDRLISD